MYWVVIEMPRACMTNNLLRVQTLLRWQSTCCHTHFECLYIYLNSRYSNLHFTALLATVEKYISQLFSFQISALRHCFSTFGKNPFFIFLLSILKCDAWFQFLFSRMVLLQVVPKTVLVFVDIFYSFLDIALFAKKSNFLQQISFSPLH